MRRARGIGVAALAGTAIVLGAVTPPAPGRVDPQPAAMRAAAAAPVPGRAPVAVSASAPARGAGAGAIPRTEDGYLLAVPPYRFAFPRDHAAHPGYRTEWWYYTGHLDAADRTFGFELTFFRVGIDRSRENDPSRWAFHTLYFAHFALTDIAGGRFFFDEKLGRPGLGLAGADSGSLHTWIDDWSVRLADDGVTHVLRAANEAFGIELALAPEKSPVIHGRDGVSQKDAGVGRASHYYSLTRLAGPGTVTLEGRAYPVTALAWMDQEFGSNQLGEDQEGWDWFSLQLDDGRDLMLYRMRLAGGGADPFSSGTLVERDGRATHLPLGAFTIEATGTWTSPKTGAVYPSGWTLRVPAADLALELMPTVRDQELVTGGTVGVHYWEGSVNVAGSAGGGRPVAGRGYVELTGYAGRVPGF